MAYFGSASEEHHSLLTNIVDTVLNVIGEWKQMHVFVKGPYLNSCLIGKVQSEIQV